MVKDVRIACHVTPGTGAGVMVIREPNITTRYATFFRLHSYGSKAGTFELRNAIKVLKEFKQYLDDDSVVKFYCDNVDILKKSSKAKGGFDRFVAKLEAKIGCQIQVFYDTIISGNSYLLAADLLSKGCAEECTAKLEGMGARPFDDD